jgi:hypothetical protein
MAEEKKPFKDTKVGQFLNDKVRPVAAPILEAVGGLTGVDAISKLGELLNDKKDESPEIMNLHLEFEKLRVSFEIEVLHAQNAETLAAIADLSNARGREAGFIEKTGHVDYTMTALVVLVAATFIFEVVFMSLQDIPEKNEQLFRDMITTTKDAFLLILAFYFGSSVGGRYASKAGSFIKSKLKSDQ